MLVSRSMYYQAIAVLYECNRAILLPDQKSLRAKMGMENSMSKRLPASRFISMHSNPSVLSHLRELEVVFPSSSVNHDGDAPPNSSTRSPSLDWHLAAECLKEHHANLNLVTLTVHMRLGKRYRPFARQFMSTAEAPDDEGLLKPHRMLLEPVKKLREGGLRRLFVFLNWDYHYWTPPPLRHRATPVVPLHTQQGRERSRMDEIEVILEREIMGQKYDSSVVGKFDWYPSQWMLDIE